MAPFPWQAVRNRLPTLDNLATRGVLNGSGMLCLAYKKVVELVSHLFFECEIFFEIWQLLLQWGVSRLHCIITVKITLSSSMVCQHVVKKKLLLGNLLGLVEYWAFGFPGTT